MLNHGSRLLTCLIVYDHWKIRKNADATTISIRGSITICCIIAGTMVPGIISRAGSFVRMILSPALIAVEVVGYAVVVVMAIVEIVAVMVAVTVLCRLIGTGSVVSLLVLAGHRSIAGALAAGPSTFMH